MTVGIRRGPGQADAKRAIGVGPGVPSVLIDLANSAASSAGISAAAAAAAVTAAEAAQHAAEAAEGAAFATVDSGTATLISDPMAGPLTQAALRPVAGRSPINSTIRADNMIGQVTAATLQAAINAAGDAVSQRGRGGVVYIPDPPAGQSWLIAGSVTMRPRVTIRGNGRVCTMTADGPDANAFPTLKGDGTATMFVCGTYSATSVPRGYSQNATDIKFEGVSAYNYNHPVIELLTATNFTIRDCEMRSYYDTANNANSTIRARYSWCGEVHNNRISCKNGTALELIQNCNAVTASNNRITGGSAGTAIKVGASMAVKLVQNTIEQSKVGIWAGGAQDDNDTGQVENLTIDTSYHEDNEIAMILGDAYECLGLQVNNSYIGGTQSRTTGRMFTPIAGIKLGRVRGWSVKNTKFSPWASEPLILVTKTSVVGARQNQPVAGETVDNVILPAVGYTATYYDTSALTNTGDLGRFWGLNRLDLVAQSDSTSGPIQSRTTHREWISQPISAAAAGSFIAVSGPSTRGGVVTGVEILEATGTLNGCRLQVGTSGGSEAEILNLADISTLSYTNGAAAATLVAPQTWRAGGQLVMRSTALGSGTGTFRVRIRWQG